MYLPAPFGPTPLGSPPLFLPLWRWVYLLVVVFYLAVCTFESIRTSRHPIEIPGTILALIIGNLGPGIGAWMAILRLPLNDHVYYRLAGDPARPSNQSRRE